MQALVPFSRKQPSCSGARHNGSIIENPMENNHSLPSALADSREGQGTEQRLQQTCSIQQRVSYRGCFSCSESVWLLFLPGSPEISFACFGLQVFSGQKEEAEIKRYHSSHSSRPRQMPHVSINSPKQGAGLLHLSSHITACTALITGLSAPEAESLSRPGTRFYLSPCTQHLA